MAAGEADAAAARCAPLHSDGACEVLRFDASGRSLLSLGADGKLILTDTTVGDGHNGKAWMHRFTREAVMAGALSPTQRELAVGMEDDSVHGAWVFPLDGPDGRPGKPQLVARFTLPVRHLAWHSEQPLLGIATDDGKLCVFNRGSTRSKRRDFPAGGGGGVRCLAFDPRGELLAAAFCNGALAVFRLEGEEEVFRGSIWPKAVAGERLLISWRPDGGALALPGGVAVKIAPRGDYKSSLAVLEGGHAHPTTAAAWASNGELLATISHDASALWRPADGQLLRSVRLGGPACSLAWSGSTSLAVGTSSGSWARIDVPEGDAGAEPAAADVDGATAGTATVSDGAADLASPGSPREPAAAEELEVRIVRQAAFQPGATVGDPKRRILAWNEHGMLKLVGTGSDAAPGRRGARAPAPPSAKVVVDYARDRGRTCLREWDARPGLRLGALGPGVCALAFDAAAGLPPRVEVQLATPAAPRARSLFELELPAEEGVEALCVGSGFVAALTTPSGYLRVQSLSGLPLATLCVSGPPVCVAACEDLLLCITQVPGPALPEPLLEFALYRVSAAECIAAGPLPLSPASGLRWAGFSAEAMPLALDSAGTLRALVLGGGPPLLGGRAGEWLPIAELEDGGARLWPVRAEGGVLHCEEVARQGDEPKVVPARRLKEVPYRLPLGSEAQGPQLVLCSRMVAEHQQLALQMEMLPAPARRAARGEIKPKGKVLSKEQVNGRERVAKHALRLFENLAKRGEVERALDVARCYFGLEDPSTQMAIQQLQAAQAAANSAGEKELAARVAALGQDSSHLAGGADALDGQPARPSEQTVDAEVGDQAEAEPPRQQPVEPAVEPAAAAPEPPALAAPELAAPQPQASGPQRGGLTVEQLAEIQRKRAAAQERKAARQRSLAEVDSAAAPPPGVRQRVA